MRIYNRNVCEHDKNKIGIEGTRMNMNTKDDKELNNIYVIKETRMNTQKCMGKYAGNAKEYKGLQGNTKEPRRIQQKASGCTGTQEHKKEYKGTLANPKEYKGV